MQNIVTQGDQVFIDVELLIDAIDTIRKNLQKQYSDNEQFLLGGQTVAAAVALHIIARLTEEK